MRKQATTDYDKVSTITGCVLGVVFILSSTRLIKDELRDSLVYALPFIVGGISTAVMGYLQNKGGFSRESLRKVLEELNRTKEV